jgi:hypothetical protein
MFPRALCRDSRSARGARTTSKSRGFGRLAFAALGMLPVLFTALVVEAADVKWKGATNGPWEEQKDWMGGKLPTKKDQALINDPAAQVTIETDQTVQRLILGGQLTVEDGKLTIDRGGAKAPDGWLNIHDGGKLILPDGSNGSVAAGFLSAGSRSLVDQAGGQISVGEAIFGQSKLVLTGGTTNIGEDFRFLLGQRVATGDLAVDGGRLSIGRDLILSESTFRVSRGDVEIGRDLSLSKGTSAPNGDFSVLGGKLKIDGNMVVSQGFFDQTGGRVIVGRDLTLRDVASYGLEGGQLRVDGNLLIVRSAFTLNGGTLRGATVTESAGEFKIGNSQTSGLNGVTLKVSVTDDKGGTVTVSNGLTLDPTKNFTITNNSQLRFAGNQTLQYLAGAAPKSPPEIVVGSAKFGLTPGTALTLKDISFTFADQANAVIGEKSADAVNPTGLILQGTNEFKKQNFGDRGTIALQANHITNEGTFKASDVGRYTVSVKADEFLNDRGAKVSGLDSTFDTTKFTNKGRYEVFTGTSTIKADEFKNSLIFEQRFGGNVTFQVGTFTNDGLHTVSDSKTKITTDRFSNNGSLDVKSKSSVTVEGITGQRQATNSGDLKVDKTSTLTFQTGLLQEQGTTIVDGMLNVSRGIFLGGKVQGSGTITGNVSMKGGVIAPGNSPGMLSIIGNYDQSSPATIEIEIAGKTFDPAIGRFDYDRLAIDGAAHLGGLLDVSLLGGWNPDPTDVYTILTSTQGLDGFFDDAIPMGLDEPGLLTTGAGTFLVNYNHYADGLSSVTLTGFQAVPEPGPLALLALLGAFGGAVYRSKARGRGPVSFAAFFGWPLRRTV